MADKPKKILSEISPGELLDKISTNTHGDYHRHEHYLDVFLPGRGLVVLDRLLTGFSQVLRKLFEILALGYTIRKRLGKSAALIADLLLVFIRNEIVVVAKEFLYALDERLSFLSPFAIEWQFAQLFRAYLLEKKHGLGGCCQELAPVGISQSSEP